MAATPQDERFMAAAIRLSRQHTGLTSTNPSVGCLIVKDGVILASAVTAIGGRPHAETQALALAGEAARGATAYVTLEPCSHYGRTPPCANALVAAGIARVVVSLADPDPRVSGRGLGILRQAGITVDTGVLADEVRQALVGYLMRQMKARPHVTLKLAVSSDGMIGRHGAGQVAITGPVSRAQVHGLRARTDAILVGIGTAIADDPELNVRLPGLENRSPIRIVLDRHLRLPLTSKLVRTACDVPVIVVAVSAPPSVLPDISPSRGEITDAPALFLDRDKPEAVAPAGGETSVIVSETLGGAADAVLPISPLEGEMPGRAEGGELAPSTETPGNIATRRENLTQAGVEILKAADLPALMTLLAARGISSLLVEGGASVARSFLDAGLIDRILLFEGPGEIGEGGIESPLTHNDMAKGYTSVRRSRFGDDCCFDYEREFQCSPVL